MEGIKFQDRSPGQLQLGRSLQRAGRGGPSRARGSPGAGLGLGRKSCLTGKLAGPSTPSFPSQLELPARASLQSPLRLPGGCACSGLAMSQPRQKPAASPRPRRAAAARHAQEVSGAPVPALGLGDAKTWSGNRGSPWALPGLPRLLLRRPFCCRERARGSSAGRGTGGERWLDIPGLGSSALGVALTR